METSINAQARNRVRTISGAAAPRGTRFLGQFAGPEAKRAIGFDQQHSKPRKHHRRLARVIQSYKNATMDHVGFIAVNGVKIDPGFRTEIGQTKILWRPLSLRAKDGKTGRVAKAKSTAMELTLLDEVGDLAKDTRIVTLQIPASGDLAGIEESENWFKHAGADVVRVAPEATIDPVLRDKVRSLMLA